MNEISFLKLKDHLLNKLQRQIIVLIGDDEGQIYMSKNMIINKLLQTGKVDIFSIYPNQVQKNISTLENTIIRNSLFSTNKLIILENVKEYNKYVIIKIAAKIIKRNKQQLYIFNCEGLNKTFIQPLLIKNNITIVNCYFLNETEKATFISSYFNTQNISLKRVSIYDIIELMPDNLLEIQNELNKLNIYLNQQELTKDEIRKFSKGNSNVNTIKIIQGILLKDSNYLCSQLPKFFDNYTNMLTIQKMITDINFMIYIKILAKHNRNQYKSIILSERIKIINKIYKELSSEKIFQLLHEIIALQIKYNNNGRKLNFLLQYLVEKLSS